MTISILGQESIVNAKTVVIWDQGTQLKYQMPILIAGVKLGRHMVFTENEKIK